MLQVFEELKTSVSGLSPDDVPYALRCVGIGLSDMQVHRLFPRLCGAYRQRRVEKVGWLDASACSHVHKPVFRCE